MELRHNDRDVLIVNRRLTPWMLWWAVGLHLVWAFVLVAFPETATLAVIVGLHPFLELGLTPDLVGIALFVAAALAGLGLVLETRIGLQATLAFLAPQYLILVIAFVSDVYLFVAGEYQGRRIDRETILVILWPLAWGALLHTLAILDRYLLRWRSQEVR